MLIRREELHAAFNVQPTDSIGRAFVKYLSAALITEAVNSSASFVADTMAANRDSGIIDVTPQEDMNGPNNFSRRRTD